MILTPENYHSPAANLYYMSVSQYKNWLSCEAATLAELRGEWEPEDREAFIVGGYVHAWNEHTLDKYIEKYSHLIFKKRGDGKYAAYEKADEMIATLERDPKIMFYLQGIKEQIITVDMFDTPWKFKVDILNEKLNYLLELKTAANFDGDWMRVDGRNEKVSFVERWGYMTQAALYAEAECIHRGGDMWRDFFMIAVSKQDPPDHMLINLTDPARFLAELKRVAERLPRILAVKKGEESPERCGTCKYCRTTKLVDKPIYYTELMPA